MKKNNNSTLNENKIKVKFVDFIRYIVNSRGYDEHWVPYYLACTPCLMRYTAIFKTETMWQDQKELSKKLNSTAHFNWLHEHKDGPTSVVWRDYYKAIPKDLIKQLYHKYKVDFDLFDYSPKEYLNL